MAVVWAGSCSSDSAPNLGTSMCCGCSPKGQKKKKKKNPTVRANLDSDSRRLKGSAGCHWSSGVSVGHTEALASLSRLPASTILDSDPVVPELVSNLVSSESKDFCPSIYLGLIFRLSWVSKRSL